MTPEDLAAIPPARLPFPVTRALASAIETRATEGAEMPTMTGHFSTFNDWYEVDSWIEGHFLESIKAGAFRKTIRESRDQMKVLYDHGQDPQIGNKVLGPIDGLREDATGPAYEVPLFDTSYNRDLRPGLEAGVYGSSFRFSVEKDAWDQTPDPSDYNPTGIPERTITEARVFEFGPVTFPANPNATAGVRSTTDVFYQRSRDPEAFETLLRSAQAARTPQGAATPSSEPPSGTREVPEPPRADTPRTPDPPPDEPAPSPNDPPDGGSSDSRSKPVEYTTREDMAARVAELEEALTRQANARPGVLPDDEQVSYDADLAERATLNADIAAWDSRQADLEGFARSEAHVDKPRDERGKYVPPTGVGTIVRNKRDIYDLSENGFRNTEERNQTFRDDAMRATELTTFPHPDTDDAATRDRIALLLDYHDSPDKELARRIKATGSPLYKRAFEKIIQGRGTMFLSPEEMRGTALAVGVDGTGGFAVPFAFDPTIIAVGVYGGAINPYRRVCRVVPIVGTDTWNALTASVVVATRTTEAAVTVEQGPTFVQPQFIVTRVQGQITLSHEMGQDRPNLSSEMASLISEAKDNEEEASMATGATVAANIGVGPVTGTSGCYTAVAGGGSGVVAAADADLAEAALPVRHRFGAQWFMNRANIRRFQAVETTGGRLFGGVQYPTVGTAAIDSGGNTGLRMLGYPVNESPSLPTATTTTITCAVLLNPQQYVIVDRIGTSIKFIPFIFGPSQGNLVTGQEAIYFMWRNTAKPLNVDAGRVLRFL